jgi:hypothetical protein
VASVSVTSLQEVLQKKSYGYAVKKKKSEKMSDFLAFGFTYQLVNGEERPQCVARGEIFANDSLNARNLRRRHASLAIKPLEFFERKWLQMRKQQNLMKTAVTTSQKHF